MQSTEVKICQNYLSANKNVFYLILTLIERIKNTFTHGLLN